MIRGKKIIAVAMTAVMGRRPERCSRLRSLESGSRRKNGDPYAPVQTGSSGFICGACGQI